MLTPSEIKLLGIKVKLLTNLYWREADGRAHVVKEVKLNWTETPGVPGAKKEPVAILSAGLVLKLSTASMSDFFVAQPLVVGEYTTPTTYVDRVLESFALICNGHRPPKQLVEDWLTEGDEVGNNLQDWAVNHAAPYWATGIGTIDAAFAMAESPEEGISFGSGVEHESREDAFPRVLVEPAPELALPEVPLADPDRLLYWLNKEIPAFLRKFNSYAEFDKAMPSACASANWKKFAYAMAKGRWGEDEVTRIPG